MLQKLTPNKLALLRSSQDAVGLTCFIRLASAEPDRDRAEAPAEEMDAQWVNRMFLDPAIQVTLAAGCIKLCYESRCERGQSGQGSRSITSVMLNLGFHRPIGAQAWLATTHLWFLLARTSAERNRK